MERPLNMGTIAASAGEVYTPLLLYCKCLDIKLNLCFESPFAGSTNLQFFEPSLGFRR